MTEEIKERLKEKIAEESGNMYSKYNKVTATEMKSEEMRLYDQALIRAWDTVASLQEDGLWENMERSYQDIRRAYKRLQSMRNKRRTAVAEGVGFVV